MTTQPSDPRSWPIKIPIIAHDVGRVMIARLPWSAVAARRFSANSC